MKDIRVREAEFDDLKPIFDLGEQLFRSGDWPILYRTWDEYEVMERFLSDSEYCLVADNDEGSLVGFVIGSVIRKKKSSWVYGYVVWMGVKLDAQKNGVGRKLFKALVRRFKKDGVNMLMADTSPENEKAIRFFDKNGFTQKEKHVYLFKNLKK